MQRIGAIVRFHRKKARLTRVELAKLSGVGKTAVFDIEQGKETRAPFDVDENITPIKHTHPIPWTAYACIRRGDG